MMRQFSQDIQTCPIRNVSPIFHDDRMVQIISNVSDFDNIWTSNKTGLRVFPPTSSCDSSVFPICALALQHETLHAKKAFSGLEGWKVMES